MPETAALVTALGLRLGRGIALGQGDPRADAHGMMPDEHLPDAIPARWREFAAGRRAARSAMAKLGLPPAAVPQGPDRAPQWPDGVAGSISHCADLCLAVVARSARWAGLGIDVERDGALDPSLWSEVLRADEHVWLSSLPLAEQGPAALAVFVAKEAAYKAQYPTSRTLFGFDTLGVLLTQGGFAATFKTAVPGFARGDMIHGTVIRDCGYVVAFCGIPRTGSRLLA